MPESTAAASQAFVDAVVHFCESSTLSAGIEWSARRGRRMASSSSSVPPRLALLCNHLSHTLGRICLMSCCLRQDQSGASEVLTRLLGGEPTVCVLCCRRSLQDGLTFLPA